MWVTEEIVTEEICHSISTYCSKRTCQNCAGPYLLCAAGGQRHVSWSLLPLNIESLEIRNASGGQGQAIGASQGWAQYFCPNSTCLCSRTDQSLRVESGSWATPPIKVNGGTGSARSTTAFNFWVWVRYLKHLYWSLLHQLRYRFRVSPYRFRGRGNPTTLSATLWSYPILRDAQIILHVASRYIIYCATFVLQQSIISHAIQAYSYIYSYWNLTSEAACLRLHAYRWPLWATYSMAA